MEQPGKAVVDLLLNQSNSFSYYLYVVREVEESPLPKGVGVRN